MVDTADVLLNSSVEGAGGKANVVLVAGFASYCIYDVCASAIEACGFVILAFDGQVGVVSSEWACAASWFIAG